MINELRKDLQLFRRGLCLVLDKALPRGLREDYLDSLEEHPGPAPRLVLQSGGVLIAGYWVQAVAAFNQYACLAEVALVIFCFTVASIPAGLPHGLWVALPAILSALVLRDAYTHHKAPSRLSQYYLRSAADAAAAGVFLLAAETLALKVSPSLAFPSPVLYRGALVCLPLISVLRMVLRVKPDSEAPFWEPDLSAEKIYIRTWRLNVLWLGSFYGLVLQNVSDGPSNLDKLRSFLPLFTLEIWVLLQQNALGRDDFIETLMGAWRKKKLRRRKESLPQGLKKGEPLYRWYVAIEAVIFMELSAALTETLWPWLTGRDTGFLRPAVCLVVFGTSVLLWRYVKNSNRAAAQALQQKIEASEVTIYPG